MPKVELTEEARKLARDVRHQIQVSGVQQERVTQGVAEGWSTKLADALMGARAALTETATGVVEQVERSDLALSAELADNTGLINQREEARQALYTAVSQIKGNVSSVLGDAGLELYGLNGETPQDPRRLRDKGAQLLKLLTQHPQTTETPLGGRLDTAAAGAALEPLVGALRDTIGAVDTDLLEDNNARHDRDAAIEAAITIERAMRLLGEVTCRMADATELLRQLRRPSLRGGGGSSDVTTDDDDGETPDGDGGGGATPIDEA